MLNSIKCNLARFWYKPIRSFNLSYRCFYVLAPIALIYGVVVIIRRWLYRIKFKKTYRLNVPVIVVGNITVGGTGKTPLVSWLALHLKSQGYTPGLISRGYHGGANKLPTVVEKESSPRAVGDEAVLLVEQTGCPMVIGRDRLAAAQHLLARYPSCDVLISDDGLQHYRLGRDIEIAMVQPQSRFQPKPWFLRRLRTEKMEITTRLDLGNGYYFPLGPLREGRARLTQVDFVVVNLNFREEEQEKVLLGREDFSSPQLQTQPAQTTDKMPLYAMHLRVDRIYNLSTGEVLKQPLDDEFKQKTIHAVAGIGRPEQFFNLLDELGFSSVIKHPFPDHHLFVPEDIDVGEEDAVILMTEKDAVKCAGFTTGRHWCLTVRAHPDKAFIAAFEAAIFHHAFASEARLLG